ncbi:MAG: peptidylprolyl isomerase [Clostridia bacterium]|nr:peptidylprolyl isomerase [Clostridia bacterium]
MANTKIQVTMEKGGSFVIELMPEFAPKTAENFEKLVKTGFYDGLTFHRVIDGFMAQGGDPMGTGMGGSDENIPGEFAANGFMGNTLSHQRGIISMARSGNPNSASSQFFICYDDASFLDGQYAAFGKVIEGMETVDSFLDVKRVGPEGGTPTEDIRIQSMKVL